MYKNQWSFMYRLVVTLSISFGFVYGKTNVLLACFLVQRRSESREPSVKKKDENGSLSF